ncbi:MAG: hypothetical protein HYX53_01070 [Chloroflexi bacterium]|nr:hypothetical protein [Chloroflexota bacterium]
MATLSAPRPRALTGLDAITVRPCEAADTPRLLGFGGGPGVRYLCTEPGGESCERCGARFAANAPAPVYIATTPEGVVVGAGWLNLDEPGEARLALAMAAGYQRHAAGHEILGRLREQAAARRLERVTTCIGRSTEQDPLTAFREAGFYVDSSFCVGGVTEVVLVPAASP